MFNIPNIDDTVKKINEGFDSTEYINDLYKKIKIDDGEEEMYKYFSEVYDDLFSDLVLKKTFISNDTKKMLELLATPIYKKTDLEKNDIYTKIEINKDMKIQ